MNLTNNTRRGNTQIKRVGQARPDNAPSKKHPSVLIMGKDTLCCQVKPDLHSRRGFTLIELLVVVLIIGILAAVALPQYQKAVLKSRFSKLMLFAKSLAQANEAYYLAHGVYADRPDQLDIGSDTNNLPDGTTLLINDNPAISFVQLANAQQVPNTRYVVYQSRSANFPATTMCESFDEDEKATWLCEKGLNGTKMETGNSGQNIGWSAYLLTGDGTGGHFPPVDIQASQSKALGHAVWEDGEWKYEWSGGKTYTQMCNKPGEYACAGAFFMGTNSYCYAFNVGGCQGGSFSGEGSFCHGNEGGSCSYGTFTGEQSHCNGFTFDACAGSKIYAGAYCNGNKMNSCSNVLYGTQQGKAPNLIGSCYGTCPLGTPQRGEWNEETRSYNIVSWKGGYCDATAMIDGVCPNGSPTGSATYATDKTTSAGWYGGYCDPTISGTCPSGSPSGDYTNGPDGQCWDGNGNRNTCGS